MMINLKELKVRNEGGMVKTPWGEFAPGALWVAINSIADDPADRRKVFVRSGGERGDRVVAAVEAGDDKIEVLARLKKALVGAGTRALVHRARTAGLPVAVRVWPIDWREDYPEAGDVLRLFRLPSRSWTGYVLGGRSPVVMAVPKGWELRKLSANGVRHACKAGLPVVEDSSHGAFKVVKRQGVLVRGPDGRYWRPGWVPVWHWGGKTRRWWPSTYSWGENVLQCGEPSRYPEGELETEKVAR